MAEYVGDGVLAEAERDVAYCLGELKDMQDEMATQDAAVAERLGGIEARLKELGDLLYRYVDDAASDPFHAASVARMELDSRGYEG